ncbi:unnamed protein product [Rhizophagus irregularis]|nr:unnamed protein product [Rhizophagus irregularis]
MDLVFGSFIFSLGIIKNKLVGIYCSIILRKRVDENKVKMKMKKDRELLIFGEYLFVLYIGYCTPIWIVKYSIKEEIKDPY